MQKSKDVTTLLTAHAEGLLIWPTLQSLSRAKRMAERRGFTVETLVVMDRPDELTRKLIAEWDERDVRAVEVDYGDPGLSRNHGTREATGDYVALLDADDLWGETWLAEALTKARSDRRNIVWHPEVNVYFGVNNHIFRHIDMESNEFDLSILISSNYWTALCLTPRDLILQVPFPISDKSKRIGFEDWSWFRETINAGAIHKVVAGTGHLIRTKSEGSINRANVAARAIPTPTHLFRSLLADRQRLKALRKAIGPGHPYGRLNAQDDDNGLSSGIGTAAGSDVATL